MFRRHKKGATSLSLIVLTVGFMALVGTALFVFYTRENALNIGFQHNAVLEDLYAREARLNYQVDFIVQMAAKEAGGDDVDIKFSESLKKWIDYYKIPDAENIYAVEGFSQIREQIDLAEIFVDDKFISILLKFKLESEIFSKDDKRVVFANYEYEKEFRAELPKEEKKA